MLEMQSLILFASSRKSQRKKKLKKWTVKISQCANISSNIYFLQYLSVFTEKSSENVIVSQLVVGVAFSIDMEYILEFDFGFVWRSEQE